MPRALLPNRGAVGTTRQCCSPLGIESLVRLATESHSTLHAQRFLELRKKLMPISIVVPLHCLGLLPHKHCSHLCCFYGY
jgi:hypothetical protein